MCASFRVMVLDTVGREGRNWLCVLHLALCFVTACERVREMLMCAAVSVVVCYIVD